MIINNPLDLIGNTPLVYVNKLSKKIECDIYLKLEKYNLTGSSKDRIVKNILINALNEGKINNKTTIIEATSGNTGIALAIICNILSLKCIIVMPENTSIDKVKMIKMYGAKIVYSTSSEKMKGSIKKAYELHKQIPNSYLLRQFTNPNNMLAHYKQTAKEIIDDLPSIQTLFICGGTYGSICGISKYLKEINKEIKIIEVKPKYKKHRIEGISSNIKSHNYYDSIIDYTVRVEDYLSFSVVKYLASNEGISVGLSSGCALSGAISYIKKHKIDNAVVFCPDGIDRYLSNKLLFDNNYNVEKEINYIKHIMFNKKDYYEDDIFIKYGLDKHSLNQVYKKLINDAKAIYKIDPSAISVDQVIDTYSSFYAIFAYRIAHLINYNNRELARKISEYAHQKTGVDIHPNAKIGNNFAIDHGTGIVIGETTIIGDNVRIYHNVTLGAKSIKTPNTLIGKKRHPTIKNNVIIYAGASILGGNTIIGNNVVIGSNVFITSSIKDNVTVVLAQKNYILKEN